MRLKGLFEPLGNNKDFEKILNSINNKRYPINVNGASESGKSYLLYGIYEGIDSSLILAHLKSPEIASIL